MDKKISAAVVFSGIGLLALAIGMWNLNKRFEAYKEENYTTFSFNDEPSEEAESIASRLNLAEDRMNKKYYDMIDRLPYNINHRFFQLEEKVFCQYDNLKYIDEFWVRVCQDCSSISKFSNLRDCDSFTHVCQSDKAKERRRLDAIEKRLDSLEQSVISPKIDDGVETIVITKIEAWREGEKMVELGKEE